MKIGLLMEDHYLDKGNYEKYIGFKMCLTIFAQIEVAIAVRLEMKSSDDDINEEEAGSALELFARIIRKYLGFLLSSFQIVFAI